MSDGGLPLPLLVWLSPSFPTGAFAYSHGLEWAVDNGQIHNSRTLREWLTDLCSQGALRTDAVLLMSAYRAAMAEDWNELRAVNDLALALAPSRERLLETSSQGDAFFTAVLASWPAPGLVRFSEILREDDLAYPVLAYPVAVGLAAGTHQIAARPLCDAFVLAAVANLVSAAIRLGPVGQTDAQGVIAALCPALEQLAAFAEQSGPHDFGGAAWGADIASMRHETQYSRLFRS